MPQLDLINLSQKIFYFTFFILLIVLLLKNYKLKYLILKNLLKILGVMFFLSHSRWKVLRSTLFYLIFVVFCITVLIEIKLIKKDKNSTQADLFLYLCSVIFVSVLCSVYLYFFF